MRARIEERRAEREALRLFLSENPTAEAIVEYCHRSDALRQSWLTEVRGRVAAERAALLSHELDRPIDPTDWRSLRSRLEQDVFQAWTARWVERDGDSLHVGFEQTTSRLYWDRATGGAEVVADYYVDPARRALIPNKLIAEFAPRWRSLNNNRPHRMGGYHDGLQSDAVIGPAEELLLFQIASDDAMTWCWGDLGAYYVFIRPDDLAKGDFGKASMTLECH